jgi:spore germination protein GerM
VTRKRIALIACGVAAVGLIAWGVTRGLERFVRPQPAQTSTVAAATAPTAHITATLYYTSQNADSLVAVRREVPLAEGIVAQGRQIVSAQLEAAPMPYVSVIPAGTSLRAFYVTERGEAFVDLSSQVASAHPGGSLTELLTVYALVNAVTANLPAVQRVQILVEGKEVDTIAGHVDVRRPLQGDTSLVAEGSTIQNSK